MCVEGDWSNASFFLVANALGSTIAIDNLDRTSLQGDRNIEEILKIDEPMPVIDVANIPDLLPVLAVYFAAKNGAVFQNIARLRLKESDRVESVTKLLNALGISVSGDENTMIVYGGIIRGGMVDACNDHRIAMTAAIASTVADGLVTIVGAECVTKSYPAFWQDFQTLGGYYEQYVR